MGTAVLDFIVNTWAPAIRKMGLGEDLEAPAAAVKKLKEFEEGNPLRLLYTTSSPSNVASWGSYERFGFTPSPVLSTTYQISCEGWEETQDGPFETYLANTYFSPTSLYLNRYLIHLGWGTMIRVR